VPRRGATKRSRLTNRETRAIHPSSMGKRPKAHNQPKHPSGPLRGWRQIAAFLGEPASVVQRWAAQGMPVRREGRFVTTTPEALNDWLGQESRKPVHIATAETDLTAELKRGISFVRRSRDLADAGNLQKS
jgi:hypothetical protein